MRKVILVALFILLLAGIAYAAANDAEWGLGSGTTYTSSGATVTVRWGFGSMYNQHEYVAAGGGVVCPFHIWYQ